MSTQNSNWVRGGISDRGWLWLNDVCDFEIDYIGGSLNGDYYVFTHDGLLTICTTLDEAKQACYTEENKRALAKMAEENPEPSFDGTPAEAEVVGFMKILSPGRVAHLFFVDNGSYEGCYRVVVDDLNRVMGKIGEPIGFGSYDEAKRVYDALGPAYQF